MATSINIDCFLQSNDNRVIYYERDYHFDHFLRIVHGDSRIGVIDDMFPLLSNLNLFENISLWLMFKKNMRLREAEKLLGPFIEELDIDNSVFERKENVARSIILKSYLLRCVVCENKVVVMLSPALNDLFVIIESMKMLTAKMILWIFCKQEDIGQYGQLNYSTVGISENESIITH